MKPSVSRILFVDEDTSFARVYAHHLEQTGTYDIDITSDSRSALKQLKTVPYQAIITEVLLPGRNGLKLIQDLRLLPSYIETPVYILTTLEAADVGLAQSLAEALGVKAYLVKQHTNPASLQNVLEFINNQPTP